MFFWFKKNNPREEELFVLFIILLFLVLINFNKDAMFDSLKKIKWPHCIDFLFLVIFFGLLFAPLSCVCFHTNPKFHGSKYYKYRPIYTKKKGFNDKYIADFEKWFDTRYVFKRKLIEYRANTLLTLFNRNEYGFYDKKNETLHKYGDLKHRKVKDSAKGVEHLIKLNEFAKKNGIDLYVIITPRKEDIYKPSLEIRKEGNIIAETTKYLRNFKDKNNVKIIYPYDELKAASDKDITYFKIDHHLTDYGSFVVYKVLMDEIRRKYQDIKPLNENDFKFYYDEKIRADWNRKFDNGFLCEYIGISDDFCKKYQTTKYRYYTHKNYKNLKSNVVDVDFYNGAEYFYPNGADYKVMLVGTSNIENFSEFIPFTFKHVKKIRINGIKKVKEKDEFKIIQRYGKEISEYKPDIMIFCISYGNISKLKDLFYPDKD